MTESQEKLAREAAWKYVGHTSVNLNRIDGFIEGARFGESLGFKRGLEKCAEWLDRKSEDDSQGLELLYSELALHIRALAEKEV